MCIFTYTYTYTHTRTQDSYEGKQYRSHAYICACGKLYRLPGIRYARGFLTFSCPVQLRADRCRCIRSPLDTAAAGDFVRESVREPSDKSYLLYYRRSGRWQRWYGRQTAEETFVTILCVFVAVNPQRQTTAPLLIFYYTFLVHPYRKRYIPLPFLVSSPSPNARGVLCHR